MEKVTDRAIARRPWPRQAWNQLTSVDIRLLDHLGYLSRRQSERSPTGATYCTPGRQYLARQLGCSVETISRHSTKLENLGIISKVQRRPIEGRWQTNLYRLTHWIAWRAASIRTMVRKLAHRLSKPAHIGLSSRESINPAKGVADATTFADLLARWHARGDPAAR